MYVCACVCARACACACVRVRVCACARVCAAEHAFVEVRSLFGVALGQVHAKIFAHS